ncbi:MAG: ParB N-terminal domain-containing protein [Planctomycetota bacterium]
MGKQKPKLLPVDAIRLDGGTQPREKIDTDVVEEYAEALRAGDRFPPVVVFFDGVAYWLADGFHRWHGHRKADMEKIECLVTVGTQRHAILYSVKANATHGLHRTNADKRRAVLTLLNDPEWSTWSDREIARQCAVSADLVGDVRKSVTVGNDSDNLGQRTYRTKHGTTATMNVRAKPAPDSNGSDREPPTPADDQPDTKPSAAFDLPMGLVQLEKAVFQTLDRLAWPDQFRPDAGVRLQFIAKELQG